MHMSSGTTANKARTPSLGAIRPVMNSWDSNAPACTMMSMVPKMRTCAWRSG
ncbi:hypothetical protein D3C84_1108750 [compost metagenome]